MTYNRVTLEERRLIYRWNQEGCRIRKANYFRLRFGGGGELCSIQMGLACANTFRCPPATGGHLNSYTRRTGAGPAVAGPGQRRRGGDFPAPFVLRARARVCREKKQ